jgi:predicted DNA-binding transcriptional regulator AlpA
MQSTIEVTGAYGKEVKVIPNPDRFPQARKLGCHRNSPLVWVKKEVLEYLKRHGIIV